MPASSTRMPASWQDVLAAPPHMVAELIDGELHLRARPAARHARLSARVCRALEDPDGDDLAGWVILQEVELHLGDPNPRDLILVPDLSGWRSERVPDIADAVAVDIRPDWVCEILSPGTERHDRLVKMDRYARVGVPWAWLLDPIEKLLEVYQLHQATWLRVQVGGPDAPLVAEPFGVELPLPRWFR